MNFDGALSYLLSLGHETLTIKLGLTNTEKLLKALGNPHTNFPSVQIAGTNGKGSVAVMLDSICRAAGVRAGLFTSPHLVSITERITINGEPISESEFAGHTKSVKEAAEELLEEGPLETLPTFFEHVTAIALLAFRQAKVELAILETGLGGRLDSTTAAGAEVVAVMPIAMDHEEYLGHTLAEIAAEKAAIIRPGVAAIIAPQNEEALEVILRQCERAKVEPKLIKPESNFSLVAPSPSRPAGYRGHFSISQTIVSTSADGRCCATFQTSKVRYDNVELGLRGRHQATNAAVAIALAETLRHRGFGISREAIIRGLETANHPGRLEIWEGQPRMLFDGAHNPAAARALRAYLDEFVKAPITLIFGAMRDKALNEMAAILFPAANELILTEFDNPRAASFEMLRLAVPGSLQARIHYAASPADAFKIAKEVTKTDGLICITGSLYLVGEISKSIRSKKVESVRAKS